MSRKDVSQLRFRELKVGDRFHLGERTLRREEMIEFASKYDPQPFHLEDAATREHPLFERMSASGWHSALVLHLFIADFWKRTKLRGLAGAGVSEIKWATPVYAGEPLHGEMEIEMVRVSASKPGLGLVTMCATLHKADGQLATRLKITGVFESD
ncbi:dehydratase [Trinickia violacea]|uniref:Dehydratase n=1 Tax=Trinickia violacea TaxID=2571746 RepID=A0A4P8IQ03_9BURK|nr:MaoC/PaaZ C-terminal domain-containing protein [Trinickia violacea]QCP50376.1 dehydratase [Trinickia violacea]